MRMQHIGAYYNNDQLDRDDQQTDRGHTARTVHSSVEEDRTADQSDALGPPVFAYTNPFLLCQILTTRASDNYPSASFHRLVFIQYDKFGGRRPKVVELGRRAARINALTITSQNSVSVPAYIHRRDL